ncbi:MAG: helicase-related protein, partial [Bryobacteraceae bacterium]
AMRAYAGESVIVYAPTIAQVEETVDYLAERKIAAVPYHGQMENGLRRRNQERWMNEEVRILVGTIAFGLGINKPAVRAVIHTSLPKSIEQYYQEAGRAGRDGLPADCVLLWRPKDAGLLAYFIEQLTDKAEKERAWQRYHAVKRFVESERCRHYQICFHFGQTPKWERCEMCDVCGNLPEWMRGKAAAAAPAKRKKRREPALPRAIEIPVQRAPAHAPAQRPPAPPFAASRPLAPVPAADAELVAFFKDWRRRMAERAAVPAYVVLSDAALDDLCRKRPANLRELLGVTGIGERKAELYGREIFTAFEAYRQGMRAAARAPRQAAPAEETILLLAEGKSFDEIAQIRGRQASHVVNMVADMIEKGRVDYRREWVGEAEHTQIEEAIGRLGAERLKPLKEALPPEITYEQVRLVVAWVRRRQAEAGRIE